MPMASMQTPAITPARGSRASLFSTRGMPRPRIFYRVMPSTRMPAPPITRARNPLVLSWLKPS